MSYTRKSYRYWLYCIADDTELFQLWAKKIGQGSLTGVDMELEAKCRATAMGIMPHTTINEALKLALTLDIPFWPYCLCLRIKQNLAQTFAG